MQTPWMSIRKVLTTQIMENPSLSTMVTTKVENLEMNTETAEYVVS